MRARQHYFREVSVRCPPKVASWLLCPGRAQIRRNDAIGKRRSKLGNGSLGHLTPNEFVEQRQGMRTVEDVALSS